MTIAEYVVVFASIILGLALATLLAGLGRMLRSEGGLRPYWVHSLLILNLFLLIYHFWMRTWELNDLESWPRIGLAAQAADLTVTYLVAVLLFPRENDTTDLRAYYYRNASRIYGLLILSHVLAAFEIMALAPSEVGTSGFVGLVSPAVPLIPLALSQRPWVHGVILALVCAFWLDFNFNGAPLTS